MTRQATWRCVIISDFNVEILNRLIANDPANPAVVPVEAPYGQVHQLLARQDAAVWQEPLDLAVVWTRPEGQLPSFKHLLDGHEIDPAVLDAEVDDFVDQLSALRDRVRITLVPTWVQEPSRAFAMLGLRPGPGAQHALLRANLRLVERLHQSQGLYGLDAGAWFAGASPFSAKLWHMSKNPYSVGVHKAAVSAIKSALRTLGGGAKKLIVLDLDDTLWGGIVGEVGWQNLRLGGHDPIGEAHVEFQRALASLKNRGILLALASRNDEGTALDAIRSNPEMRLRLDDFAAWRINWGDKAKSVAEITAELNLGLDAVVFIDDDAVQRGRVREALPDVLVPEWPSDPTQYASALFAMDCFDSIGLSDEDRRRTSMYVADRQRAESRATSSFEEWLEALEVVATCEPLSEANLARATQLLNKTNQMNLATRRLSEAELRDWALRPGHAVWAFRVADRYGDLGLTGLVGVEVEGGQGRISDFLLSCRAMGRKIEETMVAVAVAYAREHRAESLSARFVPTARNRPCLDFWEGSGWSRDENVFSWDVKAPYPVPSAVHLQQSEVPPAVGRGPEQQPRFEPGSSERPQDRTTPG